MLLYQTGFTVNCDTIYPTVLTIKHCYKYGDVLELCMQWCWDICYELLVTFHIIYHNSKDMRFHCLVDIYECMRKHRKAKA